MMKCLKILFWIFLGPVLCFGQSGTNDPGFNPGTGADNSIYTSAVQSDGKIIIGGDFSSYNGTTRNRLARLNSDGSVDVTFNVGSGANDAVITAVIQSDGKIIIGGDFTTYNGVSRNRIARINPNGTLDLTFDPGTGVDNSVFPIIVQSDGKIVIAGFFTLFNGTSRRGLVRLNTDGSLDLTFSSGTGINTSGIIDAVQQSDGKIVIGGGFTTYNGTNVNRIARVNSDGSLDASFNPGIGPNGQVQTMALQSDGKIVAGGTFTTYNGITRNSIVRVNGDGGLDTAFDPGTGADAGVRTISIQQNGNIIIGGSFSSYNGTARARLARLHKNGTLDTSFDPGAGADNIVFHTSTQPGGRVLCVGFFNSYNGLSRNGIASVLAQSAFITTWKTDKPGVSGNNQITIPTTGGGYNYNIYWEQVGNPVVNGTLSNQTGSVTITFPSIGLYRVAISGSFPRMYFYNDHNPSDAQKLYGIERWGSTVWTSMQGAFWGCDSLNITAVDVPDLSGVTDMGSMFYLSNFSNDIGGWNVSNVTEMDSMFFSTYSNPNIAGWDVSKVTNMEAMFYFASAFNQDISGWDVGNVTDMSGMFLGTPFNQDIGNWNVGNVTDMEAMFFGASSFNQDIGAWNVSKVTNMASMFGFASAFNQDIGGWDVGNVNNMYATFVNASSFNHDIGDWDVSNVTQMSAMFSVASSFNQNIGGWDVSNVVYMSGMFYRAAFFNQDIGSWDVRNVTTMAIMFHEATAFNQDISDWDVSNVTDMRGMFSKATSFNQNISTWSVSNVTSMASFSPYGGMFQDATSFNQSLASWNVGNVTDMTNMLSNSGLSKANYDATLLGWASQTLQPSVALGASGLTYCAGATAHAVLTNAPNSWTITGDTQSCAFEPFITTWKTDNPGASASNQITIPTTGGGYNYSVYWERVGNTSINGTLNNLTGNATLSFPAIGTYRVEISGAFPRIYFNREGDFNKLLAVEQWGDIAWTSMESAFAACEHLNITATDAPNLSGVTSLQYMFYRNLSMNQDIGSWDVSNITDMSGMFEHASNFNQDLSGWDVSNVTNMFGMFFFASSFNQDIGSWNVGKVTNMAAMFLHATTFNQDISNWDVSNVVTIQAMFADATSFNQNIGGWNVSNVTDMGQLFISATAFNQDIGSWNVSKVTNMKDMFYGENTPTSFDQNLGNWDVRNVKNMTNMLSNSGLSEVNYDATIIGWAAQVVQTNVPLGATGLTYCAGATARTNLTTAPNNWIITGDIFGCPQATIEIKVDGTSKPSGSDLVFSTVGIGNDQLKQIEITNLGSATLIITDIQLSGDYTLEGSVPAPIDPGSSVTLNIKFTPTNLGVRLSTLSIFSNGDIPVFTINLTGEGDVEPEVYNVVTARQNGKHDFLNIKNITFFPQNKISIFDRWGNKVFERDGYDNVQVVFAGISDDSKELPDGTYFYVLDKNNGDKPIHGFLYLRR